MTTLAIRVRQPEPRLLLLRDRPWFLPSFFLLFAAAGLAQLVYHSVAGTWGPSAILGTAIALVVGGAGLVASARREDWRFDASVGEARWHRRGVGWPMTSFWPTS